MNNTSMKIGSLISTAAAGLAASALLATTASAEMLYLPDPPTRTITTTDGWQLTVQQSGQEINRVAPLNMSGFTREFFGGFRSVATVSGEGSPLKGAKIQVGWQVGCAADLVSVGVGLQGSIGPSASLSNVGPLPVPGGTVGATLGPNFTASVKPGEITEIPVDTKPLEAAYGEVQIRDVPISVHGCIGPLNIRSFTKVVIESQLVNDGVVVYGEPRTL